MEAEPVKSETRLVVCSECGGPHDEQNCDRSLFGDSDDDSELSGGDLAATSHPLQNSRFVGGRYEILKLIGQGGAGSVYKVQHQALNKIFALKALNAGVTSDPKALQRFDAEAKTVGNLSSPYLIQVHDYGVTDSGTPYLVLDYIEGTNLADEINRLGHIDEPRALALFAKVCDGLEHAHANQIIHRDLKPSNIMLVRDEKGNEIPKIVDFGIAKRQAVDSSVTQTGEIFGTPLYMSPEQCLGKPVDRRSDIYSLGCLMYEALTGVPPLVAGNPVETVLRHINDEPVPLRKACGDWKISPELEQVVMSCLEKDAKRRPDNCVSLQRNLERIARGEKPSVHRALPRLKFNRKVAVAAVVAIVLLSVVLGAVLLKALEDKRFVFSTSAFDAEVVEALKEKDQQQYRKSVKHLLTALERYKGAGLQPQQLTNVYLTLSDLYYQLGDNNKSTEFFDKGRKLLTEGKDKSEAFNCCYVGADKATDPMRQIDLNEEAISLWPQAYPHDPDYLLHPLMNVIKEYAKLQMWDKAEDRLKYASQIITKNPQVSINYKLQVADWYGYVFAQTGRLNEALLSFRNAEQIAKSTSESNYAKVVQREEKHVLKALHRDDEADKIPGEEHSDPPQY